MANLHPEADKRDAWAFIVREAERGNSRKRELYVAKFSSDNEYHVLANKPYMMAKLRSRTHRKNPSLEEDIGILTLPEGVDLVNYLKKDQVVEVSDESRRSRSYWFEI